MEKKTVRAVYRRFNGVGSMIEVRPYGGFQLHREGKRPLYFLTLINAVSYDKLSRMARA